MPGGAAARPPSTVGQSSRQSGLAFSSFSRRCTRRLRTSITKRGLDGLPRSRTPALLAIAIVVPLALVASHCANQHLAERQDFRMPAAKVLEMLREGNERFVDERPMQRGGTSVSLRSARESNARNPLAIVLGCAELRCPVETFFDVRPGDMYLLRNVGNACNNPEDSLVSSVEYAIGALGAKLLLVLGHSHCRVMARATELVDGAGAGGVGATVCEARYSALDDCLEDLAPAVQLAREALSGSASCDELVDLATKINVFNTIEKMLQYSVVLRTWVSAGEVEVHGAVLRTSSGEVQFLGQHPRVHAILNSTHLWPQ